MYSAPFKRFDTVFNKSRHTSPTLAYSLSTSAYLAMLFLLFVYYLVQGAFIDANPIPSIYNRSLTENHCTDLSHCRTIWDIIWSCLTTVFLCTWVSVHPNVPCPKKRKANCWIERHIWNPLLSFAEHRILLFICALLVPEYVLAWAIRQLIKAWVIAHQPENKKRRWTITHGFFIIMGGFHLFEHSPEETSNSDRGLSQDDKPLYPLRARDLVDCNLYETFIMPTMEEIEDKGKGDWFAKSLVLLQTSWFAMQCIARAREHLLITHLEIVTLAYTVMNFMIYISWWYKPLDVNRPVRVFRKFGPEQTQPQVNEPTSKTQKWTWEAIGSRLGMISGQIIFGQKEDVDLSREDRVPMFWADNTTRNHAGIACVIVLLVGVCFGAIHCTSWNFSFPTHRELLMWRISIVAITAVPIYMLLMSYLRVCAWLMHFKDPMIILYFGAFSGLTLYILARAVTLVLAFTSLRDLPPGAYETVHWTTFIPHI